MRVRAEQEPVEVASESLEVADDDLIRCEVTGMPVARDETVVFQGKVVSQAGKMLLIREMMGGRPWADTLQHPNIWVRLTCAAIDCIPVFVVWYVVRFVYVLLFHDPRTSHTALVLGSLAAAIAFAYATWMHGRFGQTLGKMWGECRVVDLNGDACDWRRVAIRGFLSVGIGAVPLIVLPFSDVFAYLLTCFALVYFFVNGLSLVTDLDRRRALHDRLAATRVVLNFDDTPEEE